jgi:hypothetical protein
LTAFGTWQLAKWQNSKTVKTRNYAGFFNFTVLQFYRFANSPLPFYHFQSCLSLSERALVAAR